MSTPLTINSVETLQEALPIIRASQEAYSTFTQEQVDAICEKTAMAVSKNADPSGQDGLRGDRLRHRRG